MLATRLWSAVNTRNIKNMRENEALGYSQAYTMRVWVGNTSGALMWDVGGASGTRGRSAAPMQCDSSRRSAPTEAARSVWFIEDTQQTSNAINKEAISAYFTRAIGRNDIKQSTNYPAASPRPRAAPSLRWTATLRPTGNA